MLKKFFVALTMLAIMFTSSSALAAFFGKLRMPLCEPEPAHVEQIKAALKAHGLL